MPTFSCGQRVRISQVSDKTRRFYLQINISSSNIPIFEFAGFRLDEHNRLSAGGFITGNSHWHLPEEAVCLEEVGGQMARFVFDLDLVPFSIARLLFTVSPAITNGMDIKGQGSMSFGEDGILYPQVLLDTRFRDVDFHREGVLILAEAYRQDGEWHFAGLCQGFSGSLNELKDRFGGQNSNPSAAFVVPSPTSPSSIPPPPFSVPLHSSPPKLSPSKSNTHHDLQNQIDEAAPGDTLKLPRGEYQGPILLDKPLTIDGNGATVWAHNGPVVHILSDGVTLRQLGIEATDPAPSFDIAVLIDEGVNTQLQDVQVRGKIVGDAALPGKWNLPAVLDLGNFAARENNSFICEIEVPNSCSLKTGISGIMIVPSRIERGRATIEIRANGIGDDVFLAGEIELSAGALQHTIPIIGHSVANAAHAQGLVLWRCSTSNA